MAKTPVFFDVEVYKNFVRAGFLSGKSGRAQYFEISDWDTFDRTALRRIVENFLIVGFNSIHYDMPIIAAMMAGLKPAKIKEISDFIIVKGMKSWQAYGSFGLKAPRCDHIDLMEPNPSVRMGLKVLNGRLHGRHMQDLPIDPNAVLTAEEAQIIRDYHENDLQATKLLYDSMLEPIHLREQLSSLYGQDFRSKSDAQIGEGLIKLRVEAITGEKVQKTELKMKEFQYGVSSFIKFQSQFLSDLYERIKAHKFKIRKDGKTELPKFIADARIGIGRSIYQMGIGGLHSTESNRSIVCDGDWTLVDADVASQYPSIILKLGLYPEAVGPDFLTVYRSIYEDRLAAKKAKDKVKDQGYKIALNGTYGKLGSKWSFLYAPHLLIAVTLTGQLSLLMLIEAAERKGISVVSANTDGVVFHIQRSREAELNDLIKWWEDETGFVMETTHYSAIYNSSVNAYIALKEDGTVKRKGPIANPWATGDLRAQMMKNPQMTICGDAVVAYLKDGTPIEKTIEACEDIRSFVTVVQVKGGGTWNGEYLGKVVRYYWSYDGVPIYYKDPHPTTGNYKKVSKTDGCSPLMTLPLMLPNDLDKRRYIAEAYDMLADYGYRNSTVDFSAFMASLGISTNS